MPHAPLESSEQAALTEADATSLEAWWIFVGQVANIGIDIKEARISQQLPIQLDSWPADTPQPPSETATYQLGPIVHPEEFQALVLPASR